MIMNEEHIYVVTHFFGRKYTTVSDFVENETFNDLLASTVPSLKVYPPNDVYVTSDGRAISTEDLVQPGKVYHVIPRLPGGKGGFGSMLRAIGAQIEKTTNHEACRDLSGRRMRDVNNEKQMKEWIGKKPEKEKEDEEKRQDRLAQRRSMPNHKFDDPQYEKQKCQVTENLQDAFRTGLQKMSTKPGPSHSLGAPTAGTSGSRKRIAGPNTTKSAKVKKTTEWLGIDMEDLSDSSEEDSDKVQEKISPAASSADGDEMEFVTQEKISPADDRHEENGVSRVTVGIVKQTTDITTKQEKMSAATMTSDDCTNNDRQCIDSIKPEKDDSNEEITKTDVAKSSSVNDDPDKAIKMEESTTSKTQTEGTSSSDSKSSLLAALQKVPVQIDEQSTLQSEVIKDESLDLDSVSSVAELERLSLDRLKAELMARRMKCGGTLQQRAERLFSIRGLTIDQIHPSLLAKRK